MQTSMLTAVQYFCPDTWTSDNYHRKRYVLVDLDRNQYEYQEVVRVFYENGVRVQKIMRIQNPYIYGSYILRKEQLLHRSAIICERTMYHAVHNDDVLSALDYNLDVRRYTNNTSENCPIMYANPLNALGNRKMDIIVCKVIAPDNFTNAFISEWETERVPEYLVKI